MSNFFEPSQYESNVVDLEQSVIAITKASMIDFVNKWGEVKVSMPMTYMDFDSITIDVVAEEPELFEDDSLVLEASDELKESLNEVTSAFVEYVNMKRRIKWESLVSAYLKMGYLDYNMSDDGKIQYVLDVAHPDIDVDLAEAITLAVRAHGRFSKTSQ